MEIIRTQSYSKGVKRLRKLGASAVDIVEMEDEIASRPEAGDVIPCSGGMRKVRFGYGQSGERGGGRTIYYVLTAEETIYMIVAYAKADKDDLTKTELKLFKALVKELING